MQRRVSQPTALCQSLHPYSCIVVLCLVLSLVPSLVLFLALSALLVPALAPSALPLCPFSPLWRLSPRPRLGLPLPFLLPCCFLPQLCLPWSLWRLSLRSLYLYLSSPLWPLSLRSRLGPPPPPLCCFALDASCLRSILPRHFGG